MIPMQNCGECNKEISDDEWVVNWGSCADCLNRSLDNYILGESFIVSMGGRSSAFYNTGFTEPVGDSIDIDWVISEANFDTPRVVRASD